MLIPDVKVSTALARIQSHECGSTLYDCMYNLEHFEDTLFWDGYHPTTVALVGDLAFLSVRDCFSIPEPSVEMCYYAWGNRSCFGAFSVNRKNEMH